MLLADQKLDTVAAAKLCTDNEDLARKLRYLQEDLEMDANLGTSLDDLLSSSREDIEECIELWRAVRDVGERLMGE